MAKIIDGTSGQNNMEVELKHKRARFLGSKAFYSNKIERGIDMLPKRSTPVDKNLGSESIHSQLSVAIFRVSRNLLGAQENLIS